MEFDGPSLPTLIKDDRQHEGKISDVVEVGCEGFCVLHAEVQRSIVLAAGRQAESMGRLVQGRRVEYHSADAGNVSEAFDYEGNNRIIRQRCDHALHQQKLSKNTYVNGRGHTHGLLGL